MVKMLLLALLVPAAAFGQLQLPDGPVRLLALGDSYTIGQSVNIAARWPVQLGDSLEEIYDLSGNPLSETLISQEYSALSLAAYPDGCYIVKVSCGDKSAIRRIIKQ